MSLPKPVPETPDASIVVADCGALQDAVEQFAAENDGIYPNDVEADTSLAGNTVLELLPAGGFENPFTGSPSAPVNGAADSPGEVGYVPVAEGEWNVGYVVTGFGAEALVATLSNLGSPEEAKVIANCFIVRQAAEDMLEDNHEYPYEIDWPYCYWHLHLAHPLVNPYTGLADYTVGRAANSPGEIGYVAILQDEVPIGYVVTGYGAGSVIFALSNLGYSREEAIVASRCRTLQRSVEECADMPDGLYPDTAVRIPGVVYETIRMNGWNVGYRITGSAQGSEFIEMATSPQKAMVRLNCALLKQAVEEFAAQNGGVYPENVDSDRTFEGRNVIDLLPRTHMLENPYTGVREKPVNHSAIRQGEIGYAMVHEYNPGHGRYIPPGYVITGFLNVSKQVVATNLKVGAVEAVVMSHCRTVELAVEEFAARNEGMYPADMVNCTPYGETIADLLPSGCLLENPMSFACTEPSDGPAACSGAVGYVPFSQGGAYCGYEITGVGTEACKVVMAIVKEPPELRTR